MSGNNILHLDKKIEKKGSNLAKLQKTIQNLQKFSNSSKESIVQNPVTAFNTIWRASKIWPQKIKTLTAYLKVVGSSLKNHKSILNLFPDKLLSSFPVIDTKVNFINFRRISKIIIDFYSF